MRALIILLLLTTTTFYPVKIIAEETSLSIDLKHFVDGNDVYIECFIPDFNFSNDKKRNTGDGYVRIYINGQKMDTFYTAAFVLKDLPEGQHEIRVQVVRNNHSPYHYGKSFDVTINIPDI